MKEILNDFHWLLSCPISHRGLSDLNFVENTLPAFENSIENNLPIETDIRYTLDKKIVCFHDDNLNRLTGIDKKICDLSAEELKKIKLKDGSKVVFFKDFLDFVSGRVPLLIEIKHPCDKTIERDALEILKDYKGLYALQSFDPKSLIRIRKINKDVLIGQLIGGSDKHPKFNRFKWNVANKITKPDFISYNVDTLGENEFSIPTIAWTIRNKAQLEKGKTLAKNIIFEDINLLKK